MNKNLRDALDDAYNEAHPLEARSETLNELHKAMRTKHDRRPMLLVRILRYRMPAYQTLALASVLLAVIAWMYASETTQRIVYQTPLGNANTSGSANTLHSLTTNQTTVDTDAIVRRVVDSLRGEMQRESEKTRRSLEGVTKKSIESVARNFGGENAKPLLSPLQNDGAVGLDNLTQLQYQQRGKSLADQALSSRFNDTVTSDQLR